MHFDRKANKKKRNRQKKFLLCDKKRYSIFLKEKNIYNIAIMMMWLERIFSFKNKYGGDLVDDVTEKIRRKFDNFFLKKLKIFKKFKKFKNFKFF